MRFSFQPINTVIERDEEKMKIQSAINVGMENNGENLQVRRRLGRWKNSMAIYTRRVVRLTLLLPFIKFCYDSPLGEKGQRS